MHLMYYLDDDGKRVYSLKVRVYESNDPLGGFVGICLRGGRGGAALEDAAILEGISKDCQETAPDCAG